MLDGKGRPWRSRWLGKQPCPFFASEDEAKRWCEAVVARLTPMRGGVRACAVKWSEWRIKSGEDYREWLCSQTCCHPQPGQGPCQQGPVQPLDVLVNRLGPYGAVPFCTEHYEAWMSETPPDMGPQGGQAFLSSQALMFVQRWAQDSLRKKLKVPVGFSASPNLIFAWAADHQLRAYLPAGFNALMETEN